MTKTLTNVWENIFKKGVSSPNRLRISLFLLAGLLFVLVIVQMGWKSYTSYKQDLENQIELKKMQYKKLAKIVASSKQYKELNNSLRELRQELINKKLIKAGTLTLAEVDFQNIINELAQKSQVNIVSMRMLPRGKTEKMQTIKIGINCRAEIGSIKEFFIKVYQNPKFIFFEQFEIKIVNRRERRFYNFNAQLTAWAET